MYKDGKRRIQGKFTLSPFFIDTCTGIRYTQLSGREDRSNKIQDNLELVVTIGSFFMLSFSRWKEENRKYEEI